MALAELNRVKYGGFDFHTNVDDLRAQMQLEFASDFNDFAISSLGMMLLDIVAYGLDTLGFYLDRRASDLYLATARTRRSVARLTRQLGYKMRSATAASTDLKVNAALAYAFQVPIPKGHTFDGPNGVLFEAAEEVVIPTSSTAIVTVPVYQGVTYTETFVSDGTANQVFELTRVTADTFVVNGYVKVVVDGAPFGEKEFLEYTATDQFEVGYNDDPPTIRFGDGIMGNVPVNGATISVTYIISRGKAGLVNQDTIQDASKLVVNFTNIELVVNNPDRTIGGDDPEALEHAKTFAPKVWKSRYRAITREDYEALAGSFTDPLFGRVAVAQALSARSAADDLELQNLINGIRSLADSALIPVATAAQNINDALDTILGKAGVISTALTDIGDANFTLRTNNVTDSIGQGRIIKDQAQEIEADAGDIGEDATAGDALVTTIGDGAASSELTDAHYAALKGYFSRISANKSSVDSAVTLILSSASTIITAQRDIGEQLETVIGETVATVGTYLYTADQANQAILAEVGLSSPASGIYAEVDDIEAAVEDHSVAINALLDDIYDHVDALLSADCKANLVSVPILVRDADGFYAAPSLGLIRSLQTYLHDRKEVTQTVSVTSGESFLIPAILTIDIGVLQGFSQSVIETAVGAAVDALLRDRPFGQSLYKDNIHRKVSGVAGVDYVNVTIDGFLAPGGGTSTTGIDSHGNLIIDDSKVITKGTVTITSTVVTVLPSS